MHLLLALDTHRAARAKALFARQPFHVWFDFHGVTAGVATNSEYLAEHLRLGYGAFEFPGKEEPDVSLLALEAGVDGFDRDFDLLLPGRNKRHPLTVHLEGEIIFLLTDAPHLALYTTMGLFGGVVRLLGERFTCLHAATVSLEGRAAVLCGAARCGKTSLTAALVSQGLEYSSDDVTLLKRDGLEIAPFPRAINVREEYRDLIEPLLANARRMARFSIADEVRLIVDLGKPVPSSVVPAALCFPRFAPGRPMGLEPLSKGEALVALMKNRFHPLGAQGDSWMAEDFSALGSLVERCPCTRLTFSDPVAGSQVVGDLLQTSEVAS